MGLNEGVYTHPELAEALARTYAALGKFCNLKYFSFYYHIYRNIVMSMKKYLLKKKKKSAILNV